MFDVGLYNVLIDSQHISYSSLDEQRGALSNELLPTGHTKGKKAHLNHEYQFKCMLYLGCFPYFTLLSVSLF